MHCPTCVSPSSSPLCLSCQVVDFFDLKSYFCLTDDVLSSFSSLHPLLLCCHGRHRLTNNNNPLLLLTNLNGYIHLCFTVCVCVFIHSVSTCYTPNNYDEDTNTVENRLRDLFLFRSQLFHCLTSLSFLTSSSPLSSSSHS